MVSRLFKIEWRKIRYNRTFIVLSILYFIAIAFTIRTIATMTLSVTSNGNPASHDMNFSKFGIYQFPDVWQWVCYVGSFFFIFPVILIIISMCNEYEYRTLRQNVIDGLSRSEFMISKLISIFLFSILSVIFIFILVLGLGYTYSDQTDASIVWPQSVLVAGYFIEMLVYLTLALLLAILLRRPAMTIAIFVIYTYVADPIINYKLPEQFKFLAPMSTARGIIEAPIGKILNAPMQQGLDSGHLIASAITVVVFIALGFFILQKRDL
jgi:ABC-2 type transport system permease protein